MTATTTSLWSGIRQSVMDFILPPLCLACDTRVDRLHTLCPACWGKTHFITPPCCVTCGMPFDVPVEGDAECAHCIAHPPHFKHARASMMYDEASKPLILGFKHGDRTYMAQAMGQWMMQAGQDLWAGTDYLIPVPLHRWRLFERRYNQAALMAQAIAKLVNKSALTDGLMRIRRTAPQGHMNRTERAKNVKGAFAIHPSHQKILQGKSVTLIDDVLTTGATLNECADVLLKGGVAQVNVVTLARVRNLV